jgi:hypothetical protein
MSIIWREIDVNRMMLTFGIQCLYFEARVAPDQRYGQTKLESDAIHGFRYNSPAEERLMRTSISQRIILSEFGRVYEGGARFTIPPVKLENGVYVPVLMHERAFLGDVIVVKTKSMRDFDVLRKGYRDQLFAFDVKKILNVSSIDADGNEHQYAYGTDYTITVNGTAPDILVGSAMGESSFGVIPLSGSGEVQILSANNQLISSTIQIVWNATGDNPADGDYYTVEFLCSPNYVIYNYSDKARATEENDLPRTVMCVKRAYFNPTKPKMDEVATNETIMNTPSQVYDAP